MIQGTFRSKSNQKDGGDNTIQEKEESVVEKMVTQFEENSRKCRSWQYALRSGKRNKDIQACTLLSIG